jgi:hypothetical protein
MNVDEKIARLEAFQRLVIEWEGSDHNAQRQAELRSAISREKSWVRQEVIAADCFKTLTIGPPPAIGGMIMNRVDAFHMLFDPPYDLSMVADVSDMIDETIGVLRSNPDEHDGKQGAPTLQEQTLPGYAFVVMPMTEGRPEFDDVLDAIKDAASRCGVQAERVDEAHTTERITDRILESIRRSQYVIADLTEGRPNVYFEAGYAHALQKTPIYIAKAGTKLEFDLKDYPVIFFSGLRELKDNLEKRLRGIAAKNKAG